MTWEVLVSNIGTVYFGENEAEARRVFDDYKTQSLSGYGRAAFESVLLFHDTEIIEEV